MPEEASRGLGGRLSAGLCGPTPAPSRPRGMNQRDTEPRVIRLPRRKHQVMDLAALGCLNSIIFRISIWTRALYGPPGPVGGAVKRHLIALKCVVFTTTIKPAEELGLKMNRGCQSSGVDPSGDQWGCRTAWNSAPVLGRWSGQDGRLRCDLGRRFGRRGGAALSHQQADNRAPPDTSLRA